MLFIKLKTEPNIIAMNSPAISFQWFQILIFLLVLSISVSSSAAQYFNDIPRLSLILEEYSHDHQVLSATSVSEDLKTFYYTQTLDHFNYNPQSYSTFQQRYVMNFKYWGGANSSAPIFVFLGAEASLDSDLAAVGFLDDNAPRFNALIVFIEHRYYGKSIPFGSREEAFQNASTLGYFNSAQAIADYAEIIMHIKKELMATYSPVIVIGGSYGGMLASWLRLKYPHVALGALASSAPILYFDGITLNPEGGYYSVVSKDFRDTSETCYQTIQKSWAEIDKVASQPNGLSILGNKFKTCNPLSSSSELRSALRLMYAYAAQYNRAPRYQVSAICKGIDGLNSSLGSQDKDVLSKVFAGVVAFYQNSSCYINQITNASETAIGWSWQRCSEMAMPIGIGNGTMFEPIPFNLSIYKEQCESFYGVPPRPNWVTSYYGGHDIKLILQRFGSNIIFSNGLRDPYSSGGVLKTISPSIIAVTTVDGSHCLDILPEKGTDPDWLIRQRKTEVKIIKAWISKYYVDLKAYKQ
ncbi:Peptidase S28 [Corchorus olitorius]|uniref:Peptidase S28 n=1 Tax=Corchorus olitorius TaxID=93759 RepID=A0A1R3J627_9ROSI|nr:Peptidase S28 [Corchorus olitorius]